ncbi:hypothetical protein [Paraburkholderia ferrariae]|uniref:hypothetical protein n=1 Tax=Paraburkholderia ferrariae TaxID=386056 RepID=UPI00319E526C
MTAFEPTVKEDGALCEMLNRATAPLPILVVLNGPVTVTAPLSARLTRPRLADLMTISIDALHDELLRLG